MLNPVEVTKKITAKGIEAKELLQAKMEKEHEDYVREIANRTITFCETVIAEAIQQAAQKGDKHTYLYVNNRYSLYGAEDDDGIALLYNKHPVSHYANKKIDSYGFGYHIIPRIMIEYLRAHGYTVSTYEQPYNVYSLGEHYGTGLKISWEN